VKSEENYNRDIVKHHEARADFRRQIDEPPKRYFVSLAEQESAPWADICQLALADCITVHRRQDDTVVDEAQLRCYRGL